MILMLSSKVKATKVNDKWIKFDNKSSTLKLAGFHFSQSIKVSKLELLLDLD